MKATSILGGIIITALVYGLTGTAIVFGQDSEAAREEAGPPDCGPQWQQQVTPAAGLPGSPWQGSAR